MRESSAPAPPPLVTPDVFIRAKQLILAEKSWTKGVAARDQAGAPVPVDSDQAICYCLASAVARAAIEFGLSYSSHSKFLRKYVPQRPETIFLISAFNDDPTTTHADVLAKLDEVIAAAKRQQQEHQS